jgi:hypothetical protein
MTKGELARYGIKRVEPSDVEQKTKLRSKFDLSGPDPTTTTFFSTAVGHELKGGKESYSS